jgi:sulfide:quinone oxidoreductase
VDFNLKEVDESAVYSREGASLEFDLAVVVPPHGLAPAIGNAGLATDGWVSVDPQTLQVTDHEKILALGDVTDLDMPKTGAVAHYQA